MDRRDAALPPPFPCLIVVEPRSFTFLSCPPFWKVLPILFIVPMGESQSVIPSIECTQLQTTLSPIPTTSISNCRLTSFSSTSLLIRIMPAVSRYTAKRQKIFVILIVAVFRLHSVSACVRWLHVDRVSALFWLAYEEIELLAGNDSTHSRFAFATYLPSYLSLISSLTSYSPIITAPICFRFDCKMVWVHRNLHTYGPR